MVAFQSMSQGRTEVRMRIWWISKNTPASPSVVVCTVVRTPICWNAGVTVEAIIGTEGLNVKRPSKALNVMEELRRNHI
jgi:hypothetical protein